MDEHQHHEGLIKGVLRDYQHILDNSKQGMYIFLDGNHKVCNEKFAKLLGYQSAKEWADIDVKGSFPETFVADKSQQALPNAYSQAMDDNVASTIEVFWKKKTGGEVKTEVTLVPLSSQGHLFALHFVASK